MIARLILLIPVLMFPTFGWGTTLYMGAGETYTNLQSAMAAMSAGDTLIIRDGTYTGASNQITTANHPPESSTLWTTIKAEHDGAVLFDGEYARCMFDVQGAPSPYSALYNAHWVFEGIIWGRASVGVLVGIYNRSYVKFLRCGGFDAGTGNAPVFFAGRCSYLLFDGCYSWGRGRSSFTAWGSDYNNDHIIFRNLVSRIDRVLGEEPIYNFGMYSAQYGLVQNCIAIDTDQDDYYLNGSGDGTIGRTNWSGGISIPSTDRDANDIKIYNSIVFNSHIGGIYTTGNNYHSYDVSWDNVVVANVRNLPDLNVNSWRGIRDTVSHITFVDGYLNGNDTAGSHGFSTYGTTDFYISNSIVARYTGPSDNVTYGLVGDYQAIYGNNSPFSSSGTPIGTHSLTTINPIWHASTNPTGALKYITRIESGSNLSGQGSTGDIGANLTTLRGTTGALWGEAGYDSDTGVSMWPFPNESLIKAKMASYTGGGVNGARGFAASGTQLDGTSEITLTSYIWEYLGNQMPSDIYGTTEPTCSDGVQNGDETGIDCGGSCTACEQSGAATWLTSGGVVITDPGTGHAVGPAQ